MLPAHVSFAAQRAFCQRRRSRCFFGILDSKSRSEQVAVATDSNMHISYDYSLPAHDDMRQRGRRFVQLLSGMGSAGPPKTVPARASAVRLFILHNYSADRNRRAGQATMQHRAKSTNSEPKWPSLSKSVSDTSLMCEKGIACMNTAPSCVSESTAQHATQAQRQYHRHHGCGRGI